MQKNIVYQSWPNLEEETKAKLFSISKPQEMNPRLLSSNIIGRVLILETPNSASKTVRIRKPKKRKWRLKTKVKSVLVYIIQRQILPKWPDTVLWSSVPHISISMNFFQKNNALLFSLPKRKFMKYCARQLPLQQLQHNLQHHWVLNQDLTSFCLIINFHGKTISINGQKGRSRMPDMVDLIHIIQSHFMKIIWKLCHYQFIVITFNRFKIIIIFYILLCHFWQYCFLL